MKTKALKKEKRKAKRKGSGRRNEQDMDIAKNMLSKNIDLKVISKVLASLKLRSRNYGAKKEMKDRLSDTLMV